MRKVKNIYFDTAVGGDYSTGLILELEGGTFLRHQSTDPVMPFETFTPREDLLSKEDTTQK